MDDVARECGLSKMTVSRVFQGYPGVSAATREKVLSAAKRLEYEPNVLAQNLNSNRAGYIGVATPFEGLLGSHYFSQLLQGFGNVMKDTGFDFALFDTLAESFNDPGKLAKLYRQRKVDGLFVVAPHMQDDFIDTLSDLRVPLIVIGENISSKTVCSFACNDKQGISLLCSHLLALGHSRVAFIGGPQDLASASSRRDSYRDFLKKRRVKVPDWYVQPGAYDIQSGREAGIFLLNSKPRPTAIIAANDLMAFGVMESARMLNLQIPEDISICGFDDIPASSQYWPPLTTVHQPVKEMGEQGARLLLDSLKRDKIPRGQTEIEVTLVVRQTTAAPRK